MGRSHYVITGGPGSGKTTLVDALEAAGYPRSVEVGRQIIEEQVAISGRALPWLDPDLFAEVMLAREMRNYHALPAEPAVAFCDRGVPDVLGYLRLAASPIPQHMWNAAALLRYNPRVFIVPPWPEIYTGDEERKQSVIEARRTHDAMMSVYGELGYRLLEVPRDTVAARVEFILANLDR